MPAYQELINYLQEGETVEAIVFGEWGWGGYNQPEHSIPDDKRGIVLTLEEAAPYMTNWSFNGGYGSPECYAVNVWTSRRIIFVVQYDGATGLNSVNRYPVNCIPEMPGG